MTTIRTKGSPQGLTLDLGNLDVVITTMYAVISGPVGEVRDWDLLRSLYHPEARLILALSPAGQASELRILTVNEFIRRLETIFAKESFWERETSRDVQTFGSIAHVLSCYESLREPNGVPFTTGKKTMQLYFDHARWWIMSAMWNTQRRE